MPRFRTGTVTAVLSTRPGLQRVEVDGERAYALTRLVGEVGPGDEVVVNTTAVDLDLGTGGWHPIHLNISGLDRKGNLSDRTYESPAGASTPSNAPTRRLGGMPVVVCTVHSQLACVAAALHDARPSARIVYLMTSGAALPMAFSDLVVQLIDRRLISATVTASPAFGGDHEAADVSDGLMVARHELQADAVIVAMGPGVVGTSTEFGTTALEAVDVLDVAGALGGIPILAVRASAADRRARHRGVSHHTASVLRMAQPGVRLAAPKELPLEAVGHDVRAIDVDAVGLLERADLDVTSMGRGVADDPMFFAAAAAAGVLAAEFVEG